MEDTQRRDEAIRLLDAYRTRAPIDPIIERFPTMTLDDAYAIQSLQIDEWRASGAVIRGHKVGLTSRAMQKQIGVDQPDFGVLRDDMFLPESTPIDTGAFLQPRVEPEIAFILGRELRGPGVSLADAVRAIDWVVPALELIDSRISDWRIGFFDTVADNASSGAVVLGSAAAVLMMLQRIFVAVPRLHAVVPSARLPTSSNTGRRLLASCCRSGTVRHR